MTDPSELIKTLTRPLIALAFVGMFIGALFTGRIAEIPEWLRSAGLLAIGWWFVDRTVQKVVAAVAAKTNGGGPFKS